ncbi:MAG: hypothetical protein C0200_03025 [Thermoproteota archaeon]|nr:MAG: hypothetical protein C0200_03025 [Candidatus Korarchaeota archaeon]
MSISQELIQLFPKIALSILLIMLFLLIIKGVNRLIRWLLKVSDVEGFLGRYSASFLMTPITQVFIVLSDLGLIMLLSAILLSVFLPAGSEAYNLYVSYLGRIGSVAFLAIIFVFGISSVMSLVKLEDKVKGMIMLISLLMIFAVLIDLTNLGGEIKAGLVWGISLGVGITIGVFSIWFFFKESIDSLCRGR